MRILSIGLLLSILLSHAPGAMATEPPEHLNGLIALPPGGRPIARALLDHPLVSGVVVRGQWQDVEPAEGIYDWRYFDREIDRVGRSGKPVSLVINSGGRGIPAWLLAKGVQSLSYMDPNPFHATAGEVVRVPLFWDATFLHHKTRFIRDLGKRYAAHPAVRSVSAQCANAYTDDWYVPSSPEVLSELERLGFSVERLIAACKLVLDETARAFPRREVKMAIGRIPPPLAASPDAVAEAVAGYARQRHGDRFVAQRHNLSARTPRPGEANRLHGWGLLYGLRPGIAAQMLWPASDTRSCRMNGKQHPCDAAAMLTRAGETAIAYGMGYVEIYAADLTNPELAPALERLAGAWSREAERASADAVRAEIEPPGHSPPVAQSGVTNPPVRSQRVGTSERDGPDEDAGRRRVLPGERASPWATPQVREWHWVNAPDGGRTPPGVEHHTFQSTLVGEPVGFSIYLPPSYGRRAERYPVIYWLHGKGGDESRGTFISQFLEQASERRQTPESIMVFVNGGRDSFYSDSYDGGRPVETMIMEELIPHIDAHFRTIPERAARHLQGFSMGGFGALKLAAKYPERFASVAVFGAALLDRDNPSRQRDASTHAIMFDNDLALFEQNTPAYWFKKNRAAVLDAGLRIRVIAGGADGTRFSNERMHELLNDLGIAHEFGVFPDVRHVPRMYYEVDHGRVFAFQATVDRGE